jgi:dienelactone hydrolase
LRTGSKAALLVPESLGMHVLALDWPWNGPHRMQPGEFLRRLPEIRRALLRSPGAIALGLEAVASCPEVRADRIAVVGVSLGNAPAIAAARLTERARAGIFVHGAADLRVVLRHATQPHVRPPALGALAAAFAARLLQPLEPSLHAAAWAKRPVLIISAAHDERLPLEAVRALHAAFASAEHRWRHSAHVGASQAEEIAAIATEASAWLASQAQEQPRSRR